MTRAEIIELSARRMKFARIYAVAALVYFVLVACLSVAIVPLSLSRGERPFDFNLAGLLLLATGAVLATREQLSAERQPLRHSVGPLTVQSRPGRLMTLLAASVLNIVGFCLIAAALFSLISGGIMIGLASAFGLAMIGALVHVWVVARQLHRGEPILVVSEEGVYAPAVMQRPLAWTDIESVPVAASGTPLLIALKARNAGDNHRSFWWRPLSRVATHAVYARAADATQADILLAIAHYRPALIDAMTLPAAKGLRGVISPARTI